ncbi:dicarboxylate/amino acid:cation symporter [Gammaproteobacteria bacterium]|jgi:Na+/H+-dicarboxylate symporter|uniref:Sodium:dicarboxylate symporter n=4 Tax=OM182 clade TaxID=745002 RepID=A0A0R2S680_9GAMM|nr:MAG: sodium:dicarboxylate symporter [OM182 bacterium BACL3 MAG-120507-bin80]KRO78454.1 MAG: sodium:dicarboxylate symporter [OM182 bacterium BACL3 MAG-120619-bin3]KRO79831.1 MAG: sodium:dicarboxylate symporter [OM182 bacterium BACL3 MAG-120920-bin41]MCH9794263.1 dicarboxylate/amino acid:cation symporter [Gammaproteobacteria bacterium]MDB9788941.1 dicarboxylate/amino acid:cation symporter [Gammaproteobacteria bacterium]
MLKTWFAIALWKRILLALVLGVIAGMIWGPGAASISWLGDLFVRLIRMVVVPLVFVTLVSGVVAMGDPAKLGSLGAKTLAIYMVTTLAAIVIGLILAAALQPGVGVDLSAAAPTAVQEAIPLSERLLSIVPSNPIAALAEGNILAIIFFALLVGVSLLTIGEKGKPVAELMDSSSEMMLRITHWVMEVAPFGVFALIAAVAGTQGVAALLDVLTLALAVALACVIHVVVVHGVGIIKLSLGLSPLNFFKGARDAMLVAFSTSSSSATLPVSMSVAEDNLGIKPVVASTVLPLGATINMDGTALYVGIVSVFAAQAFGIDLSLTDYAIIAGSTTLVSIGTAAVPGASLFLMAAVMGAIGISPEQIAIVIGFILPFDRPLDMLRTVVNICGDLSVATAVANWEGEFDREIFDKSVKY